MRGLVVLLVLALAETAPAAELESRVLTHYLPQDFLETAVRTEAWTEVVLKVNGGVRKGDVVRIWSGGSIDRGNGDQPGENTVGPSGQAGRAATDMALSQSADSAFALLFKTEGSGPKKAAATGKPLEITAQKDQEKLWIGLNDVRGRYQDNHLGRGRRHEHDPLWVRVEVVRLIVD